MTQRIALYDAAVLLTDIGFCLLRGFLFAAFAAAFSSPRKFAGGARCAGILFALFYTVLLCGLIDRWEVAPGDPVMLLRQGVIFLLTAALLFLFWRVDAAGLLFLSVTTTAVSDNCLFLANEWMQFASRGLSRVIERWGEAGLSPEDFYRGVAVAAAIILFVFYTFDLLLTALALRLIARFFADREEIFSPGQRRLRPDELAFLLFPAVAGWLVCLLLRMVMLHTETEVYYTLYERYPALLALIPMICLASLATMVADVRVFSENRRAARERSEKQILEHQVLALQEQIAVTEAQSAALKGVRHDMKNHVAVIAALHAGGREEELADYLAGLSGAFAETALPFCTGLAVADALLAMKREAAIRDDPALVFDASALVFPRGLRIEGYELGVLLSNALDNAVEACAHMRETAPERKRFIRLRSRPLGEMFFLEAENSFDETLAFRPDGLPVSRKPDGEHGIGMENIRRIVARCNGGMEFATTDGIFTLTVMLQRG